MDKTSKPGRLGRREVLAAGAAIAVAPAARAAPVERVSPIVELRQYTLRGGRRDELIALFEAQFIESQEAVGAHILGLFRDLDDPDRFVWLRGFPSMDARAEALKAFYFGPVWKAHRSAANATILDSDNVLLLRPARPDSGFAAPALRHDAGEVLAFVHYLDDALTAPFTDFFEAHIRPQAQADGAQVLASLVSETSPNTFPQLPVREKDRVFIWFARTPLGQAARFLDLWRERTGWRDAAGNPLLPAFMRKPEVLRLQPTARSPLA
jgi:hypothetical protein